jgi:hypothetical protein
VVQKTGITRYHLLDGEQEAGLLTPANRGVIHDD